MLRIVAPLSLAAIAACSSNPVPVATAPGPADAPVNEPAPVALRYDWTAGTRTRMAYREVKDYRVTGAGETQSLWNSYVELTATVQPPLDGGMVVEYTFDDVVVDIPGIPEAYLASMRADLLGSSHARVFSTRGVSDLLPGSANDLAVSLIEGALVPVLPTEPAVGTSWQGCIYAHRADQPPAGSTDVCALESIDGSTLVITTSEQREPSGTTTLDELEDASIEVTAESNSRTCTYRVQLGNPGIELDCVHKWTIEGLADGEPFVETSDTHTTVARIVEPSPAPAP